MFNVNVRVFGWRATVLFIAHAFAEMNCETNKFCCGTHVSIARADNEQMIVDGCC